MNIKDLNNIVSNSRYLLLGEMHGVRENIDLLHAVLVSLKELKRPIILGFEWPKYTEADINNYIKGQSPGLLWKDWEFLKSSDGRISQEHVDFLIELKNLFSGCDFSVVGFDREASEWNMRDESMARSVKESIEKTSNALFLGIMGAFHARKKEFLLDGIKYTPMASFLPPLETISCELKYRGGEYFNMGLHPLPHAESESAPKPEVIKSTSELFDYDIFLPQAHPVKPLTNL